MSEKITIEGETRIEATIKLATSDSAKLVQMLKEKGTTDIILRDMELFNASIKFDESPNELTLNFIQKRGV